MTVEKGVIKQPDDGIVTPYWWVKLVGKKTASNLVVKLHLCTKSGAMFPTLTSLEKILAFTELTCSLKNDVGLKGTAVELTPKAAPKAKRPAVPKGSAAKKAKAE